MVEISDESDYFVPHYEEKTCQTTDDSGGYGPVYTKEFYWDNIHLDPISSMFLNTGMAVSEDENKRVLLHLGAARRILDVETWPSVGTCTVEKCKFTNDQLTNSNVNSYSGFNTSNLTSYPSYASGFRFTCSSEITRVRVKFTDLDTTHKIYPRMSIPVTNYVKVWDSYCKTAVNKGHASQAYLVGNKPPDHLCYSTRDYNGIRCDSIGGFHRYSNDANDPAYIAVFFGFRIRVCNFFVSMPNKAPENLVLYMDGNEIAKVTTDSPDKVSDLLDWYNGSDEPNDLVGSSFKLVWPTTFSAGEWTIAHCTRITISYTEPGSPIRHWKSTLQNAGKYAHEYKWEAYQTEHPIVKNLRDQLGSASGISDWNHNEAVAYTRDHLCKPGIKWNPLDGARKGYTTFSSDYDTQRAQRAGALFFRIQKEVNLTAFIINLPDFGEKLNYHDNKMKLRQRSRTGGMKLIAQSGDYQNERVIAEFDKGQIAAGRLNLLDYRNTNYLSRIKSLTLLLDLKDVQDDYESMMNSIDIFYFFNEFTPQKVWESTHRLKNSPVALPSYIGVKDEAMMTVQDTNRYHGHTKQMMTEGFPHYWKARDLTNRCVNIDFNGQIVMTSFIFETCRKYRKDNYRQVKLECKKPNGSYEVICETPQKVGKKIGKSSTEEYWSSGDHIEMFDHKKIKHMPFLTGKQFRLSFPDTGTVAVGKISVGYYDVNDESRDSKWVPGEFDKAQIIHPSADSVLQRLNSNPFTYWAKNSTNYLEVEFLEKVKIKNVILGIDIRNSGSKYYPVPYLDSYGRSQPNVEDDRDYQNIDLEIDNTRVAYTDNSFSPVSCQTHIHFFEYTDNENGLQDSEVYRHGVNFRSAKNGSNDASKGPVEGQNVKLVWGNNYCRMATLEIIYSKIVPSDLILAERACLAAHNNYRFRHGISNDYNYLLAYTNGTADSMMTSARNYAQSLLDTNKFEHSENANNGIYGENLFRIRWTESPSEYDQLAVAGEAVKQWYSEYVNYDTDSGERNGNILHDGQIGHFLQVICKGSTSDGKIGIGIKSKDTTTIVCVQYNKLASSMTKQEDYIKYPSYIGAESQLTIHEEKELREVIAEGNENLSGMSEAQREKLFDTCKFYLKKSLEKLKYMKEEANDQFTDIIENGYSKTAWTTKLGQIEAQVIAAEGRTLSYINNLTSDISGIRIPNSLAETSFRDLRLTGFFLETIDVLGLTILVDGDTPDQSIIANATINAIISCPENGWVNQNDYKDRDIAWDTNGCPVDNQPTARKCIRVMLGLFGVQTGHTANYKDKEAEFTKAWEKIIRRLKWVFKNSTAPKAIIVEYNRFNGSGLNMDSGYLEKKECTEETHTSRNIEIQFDQIK